MAATLDLAQARELVVRQLEASRGDLVRLLKPATDAAGLGVPPGTLPPLWRSARWFVRRWWRGHPLKGAASVVEALGRQKLAPIAARHPWALLGGAALGGGVLAWALPRHFSRWLLPLLAVEARRVASALLAQALR